MRMRDRARTWFGTRSPGRRRADSLKAAPMRSGLRRWHSARVFSVTSTNVERSAHLTRVRSARLSTTGQARGPPAPGTCLDTCHAGLLPRDGCAVWNRRTRPGVLASMRWCSSLVVESWRRSSECCWSASAHRSPGKGGDGFDAACPDPQQKHARRQPWPSPSA
jgi:hypothetical protein